jgi:cyclic pyranopterin phosphate synthase
MEPLVDRFNRTVTYLRVSITDRCNLRCLYCVPRGPISFGESSTLLTFEEIARVVGIAAGMGVSKIRLTGGEPLVRRGVVALVEQLARVPGIRETAMTTNATLLTALADPLRQAGLSRLNISLDTLSQERFQRISGNGALSAVLEGIDAAVAAGFSPLKLNVVVLRDVNDGEIRNLVEFAASRGVIPRFIEVMPFALGPEWKGYHLPCQEMLARIADLVYPVPLNPGGSEPATYYRLRDGRGVVGLITPISCSFCARCNRLRLTADGFLRPCLFREGEVDLKAALRAAAPDEEIAALIRLAVAGKPEVGTSRPPAGSRPMLRIGG